MAIQIGKTISHYRILQKLGEGGMGIVYKAEDTKLKRTAALKFLAPHMVGSKEEKTRLIHEAQAAAALDHPNICTVHEIDEVEGQTFIAMAYIDGESLKERIESGPLKLDQAVDIAIQIAEGLQEAQEKGIVHRDIKSANIMLTEKDQVKIMDFGLAKLGGRTKITKTGTTVGTVAYMSPEQARGEEIDHRTDIWSLGVILYEMVTGQLPFKGDYEQAVIYSILNEEQEPITGLRTAVPLELERIVNTSLEKEPSERCQHADDLAVDLKKLKKDLESGRITTTQAQIPGMREPKKTPVWLVPTSVLVLFIAAGLWFLTSRSPRIESSVVLS
ncbi:MAG: serine/threonine-protein kinase [Candidatus Neomarinimicrobiota bacterium]